MGKALYRKYRPTSLAEVVGEEQVTAPLAEALKTGKFSHAYLFTGPRGCGKTSVARIFAHEVNQFKYEIEDEYIDIIEIDAASNTGVDNIRELREKACIVPSLGQYKIYIIDEVHMLSKSAFNALLKTLEEPPEHVIFVMATTDPEKVPVTILSRAQVYQFRLVDHEIMQQHLQKIADAEKIPIEAAALALIAKRGGGSFRDSLSLLDQISTLSATTISAELVEKSLALPAEQSVKDLLNAYRAADLPAASSLLKQFYSGGGKAPVLAEELISAIIANPDPVFYRLLEQLTSVRDPFAEAKLLLCFMPQPQFQPQAQAQPISPQLPVNAARPTPPPAPSPASPAPVQAAPAASQFDWQAYLNRVDTDSARLRILLSQSSYAFDGHTLTIIPGNHQAAKAFARTNDLRILKKQLPDYQLSVADFGEKVPAAQKDATISQISDIMGNIQEFNNSDGGNPF